MHTFSNGFLGWGQGACVQDDNRKKKLAIDFINVIRALDPQVLNALIVEEAGEELAEFFLSYSANLISRDPGRVLENTSSLMLMGYLIRSNELRSEERQAPQWPLIGYAQA